MDYKNDYYDRLSNVRKKQFRKYMCNTLDISDTDLYRRLRLNRFTKVEQHIVLEYISQNPL